MTELGLALPVLMMIAIMCGDLSRFAYFHVSLTNAVRAGAAFASQNPYTANTRAQWNQEVQDKIVQELNKMNIYSSAKLTMATPTVTEDADGYNRVNVQAQYVFDPVINWPAIPNTLNLSRNVVQRMHVHVLPDATEI